MSIKDSIQYLSDEQRLSAMMQEEVEKEMMEKMSKNAGRPVNNSKKTKLSLILEQKRMSRKDLYDAVAKKYPDEPLSPDAISRIASGDRTNYNLRTLYRICGALSITPNMVLDWEKEVL